MFEKNTRELSPNECINEKAGKGLRVTLDFTGDDGHKYRIVRHRKDGEYKNNVYLFQDKHNITAKSNRDTNSLIEDIIQMDYSTFTNSILFGQGMMKTFTMATDAEKKKILDQIIKLDIWSKALDVAKKKFKQVKDELVENDYKIENKGNLIDSKLSSVESIKDKMEREKVNTKLSIEELEKEIKDEKESTEDKLSQLNKELKSSQKDLDNLNLSSKENKNNCDQLSLKIDKIRRKLHDFDEYGELLNKKLEDQQQIKVNLKIHERQVKKLLDQYHDISSGVGNSCPVCGQDITKEGIQGSLDHITFEGKKEKGFVEKCKKELKDSEYVIGELKDKLSERDDLKNKGLDLNNKLLVQTEENNSLKKQENLITNHINHINEQVESINEHKELNRLNRTLEEKKKSLDSNPYEEIIATTKEGIKKLEKEKSDLQLNKMDLMADKKNLEFAVSAFGNSGIKSYILDSVTPYLNQRANYYLGKLTGGSTEVEFTTQTKLANGEYRDKFDVKIDNHIGGSSYKKNSRGERKRVDLAISLALQDLVMTRTNSKFNFLLYDECFEGLDDIGCENVMELLQEMQKKIPSIFVITHNDTLKSFFEHTLLVTKKNGETTVRKIE